MGKNSGNVDLVCKKLLSYRLVYIFILINFPCPRYNNHPFYYIISADTCLLLQKRVKFLDHMDTINGIERDPDKIEKIKNWLRGYSQAQKSAMIGCLWSRVHKQPIIALYFESETVLKFYNLEAWAQQQI